MNDVEMILAEIVQKEGFDYLDRSPYSVYQKLISSKIEPAFARLVLTTLLTGASVKARDAGDEKNLSKDFQKECFLRKKAADDIAAMYVHLFSEENMASWKKREYAGFEEFCDSTWEFEWGGSGKWSRGGGYYDCWCTVTVDVKVADKDIARKEVSKILQRNPFTDEDTIFNHFEKKMIETLKEDFDEYISSDDYYPPVMEDYDAEYSLNKRCQELGLKIIYIGCEGDMSDFEPDDMRW